MSHVTLQYHVGAILTTAHTVNHTQLTQPGYRSNLSLINLRITFCYGVYLRGKRLLSAALILLKVDNLKLNNALSTIEHATQSQERITVQPHSLISNCYKNE